MLKSHEYSQEYLQEEYRAMQWLFKQGVSPENIRGLTWGRVDESNKTISIVTSYTYVIYDMKLDVMQSETEDRTLKISFKDSECEWFFTKSKFICPWIFTVRSPKTWRKEQSREVMFPLEEIERICSKSVLTKAESFGNIEVSNLNLTKLKNKDLIEAEAWTNNGATK